MTYEPPAIVKGVAVGCLVCPTCHLELVRSILYDKKWLKRGPPSISIFTWPPDENRPGYAKLSENQPMAVHMNPEGCEAVALFVKDANCENEIGSKQDARIAESEVSLEISEIDSEIASETRKISHEIGSCQLPLELAELLIGNVLRWMPEVNSSLALL